MAFCFFINSIIQLTCQKQQNLASFLGRKVLLLFVGTFDTAPSPGFGGYENT